MSPALCNTAVRAFAELADSLCRDKRARNHHSGSVALPDQPWVRAGRAFVEENFDRAIGLYDEIGSLTDVALVQLRAAQKLVAAGQRSEAEVHLRSAMSFYRSRRATRFIREAETLLAATA